MLTLRLPTGVALHVLGVIPTSFLVMAQEQACDPILANDMHQGTFFFSLLG